MSRFNRPVHMPVTLTHEGAPAKRINAEAELRRSVLSCLLWENEFYEDGQSIADRINEAASRCTPEFIACLAHEARTVHGLRHAPLLLLLNVIRRAAETPKGYVAWAISTTITRPDEMMELLALYWKDGKRPLSGQLKKGLAKAIGKFSEYSLAKYNRDNAVKLRDVLFLTHPKPKDLEQAALFKRIADNTLQTPDTWEVALSSGADKKEAFTRLIREGKLGYMALLRNLRNMEQAGVDRQLVRDAIEARVGSKYVLPFRYVAAARAAPSFEPSIDKALMAAIAEMPTLKGRTVVLIDVSGSMGVKLSARSDMTRMDAAAALGAIIQSDDLRVITFSCETVEVPPRRGMAGIDAIINSQGHGGTYLGRAVERVNALHPDRLIVITDEQSHDFVPTPTAKHAYMINVASYKNGVGYGNGWIHIDGFSENVLTFIHENESAE